MVENEKVQSIETQTNEERNTPLKPDGILTKKMNGKTFVIEIYFDKKSKDTFQGKLLKVVQADKRLESK